MLVNIQIWFQTTMLEVLLHQANSSPNMVMNLKIMKALIKIMGITF